MAVLVLAACSSERALSPAPQPQKRALLQCSVDGQGWDGCGPRPLLLIDGKAASWDSGEDLNPSAIEQIEVIKGQAALRLYGESARHGVVQITTKRALKLE